MTVQSSPNSSATSP